jgi:hypothetical protein
MDIYKTRDDNDLIRNYRTLIFLVGFETIRAVVMKCPIFWDITSCSEPKVKRRFRGTYRLHLQGRRIWQTRHQREVRSKQSLFMFLNFPP